MKFFLMGNFLFSFFAIKILVGKIESLILNSLAAIIHLVTCEDKDRLITDPIGSSSEMMERFSAIALVAELRRISQQTCLPGPTEAKSGLIGKIMTTTDQIEAIKIIRQARTTSPVANSENVIDLGKKIMKRVFKPGLTASEPCSK